MCIAKWKVVYVFLSLMIKNNFLSIPENIEFLAGIVSLR